jgi:hypothetical protein
MPESKRFIFCLFLAFILLLLNFPVYGTDNSDPAIYETISKIEKQVYNKQYKQENFYLRLERLEKSIFNSVSTDTIYNRLARLQEILEFSKSIKIESDRQNILNLLETRYFGQIYKDEKIEQRLSRLEESMFERIVIGNLDYRFENLIKQMPASNQQKLTKLAAKKSHNISSNYFTDIQKSNNKEHPAIKDFPIYIFISPESDTLVKNAKKAIQIWSEYIQILITDQISDADIVISWKKNYSNIIKLEQTKDNDEKKYYIYCGKYKDSKFINKFLVHQIGHSLGIWGHSNNKNDIMYPFIEFKNDINYKELNDQFPDMSVEFAPSRPSDRDINTLIKIYQSGF